MIPVWTLESYSPSLAAHLDWRHLLLVAFSDIRRRRQQIWTGAKAQFRAKMTPRWRWSKALAAALQEVRVLSVSFRGSREVGRASDGMAEGRVVFLVAKHLVSSVVCKTGLCIWIIQAVACVVHVLVRLW
mmetsp:Transcript_12672/g.28107  ORF Transcript_12672/g.28107 Transcript_12672/m.28107 type:complete len:130 (+) Transcript_12672:810-1199(+)